MKTLLIMACMALAAAYEDVDDSFVPTLVTDRKALQEFLGCLSDKTPCNEFGERAKSHVIEVLSDGCRECDATQRHYLHLVINLAKSQYPEYYEAFEAKYDPTRQLLAQVDEKIKDS